MNGVIREKTCAKCRVLKTVDQFYRDAKAADGYGSWCRSCKGIKGEVRYLLPEIEPEHWLSVFCEQVTCLRCDGKRFLSLYVAGKQKVPTNIAQAKELVRAGSVFCRDCAALSPSLTLTQRLKAKNRLAMIEERINETDYLVEQELQLGKNAFLRKTKKNGDSDAVVHDAVVDKFTKRRMNKHAQDDLNERLPIITESKARTIRKREPSSYDYLVELEVI